MALKNVSGSPSRTGPAASATAGAKGAANSSANTVLSNAGASDSSANALAADFLAVLTGFGAQTPSPAPPAPAKPKDNATPARLAPAATTGSAGATLPAALLPTAPVVPTFPAPATATSTAAPNTWLAPNVAEPDAVPPTPAPATLPPTAAAPAAQPSPPAAPIAPPPAMAPPTLMPAPAPPATAKANRATALHTAAATSSTAKPGNAASAVAATDSNGDADTPVPAPAPSTAWLSPGMRVPTLQPATTVAASASTMMNAAVTSETEESEPIPDPAASAQTSVDGAPEIAKSVTEAAAVALNTDAPAGAQPEPSTPADDMSNATAAAAAAQAGPPHNPVHSQSSMESTPVLRATVGSAAWTEELGTHLTWMARQGQDSALLHLSPEHLGPVDVRIDVRDGATSVWFGAAHADTRSALEQSLPRLRELFAASGLLLADAGVARDAPRQNARPAAALPLGGNAADTSTTNSKVARTSTHTGLVDTYV